MDDTQDPLACTPGQTGQRPCEMCGTMPQVCSDAGRWEDAGSCENQGFCEPGEFKFHQVLTKRRCGSVLEVPMLCTDTCIWAQQPHRPLLLVTRCKLTECCNIAQRRCEDPETSTDCAPLQSLMPDAVIVNHDQWAQIEELSLREPSDLSIALPDLSQ